MIGFYSYGVEFWVYVAYVLFAWCLQRFLPWRLASRTMIAGCFALLILRAVYGLLTGANHEKSVKTAMMMAFIRINFAAQNLRDAAILRSGKEHKLSEREIYYAQPLMGGYVALSDWVQY